MNFKQYVNENVQGIKIKKPIKTCKRCVNGPNEYYMFKNKNKVRIHESIDDKFADFPDDQRYYKGTKVRILGKEPSDKEKMIWIQKKDGTEEEVEMDELAMSSEDSLDNKKPSNEISSPANGQRGEMTSKS